MSNLNNLPLIVYVMSLSCPSPTKSRKDEAAEVAAKNNAQQGVFKVQQEKIPEQFHAPISKAQNRIRTYFNKNAFRLNDRYAIPVGEYANFEAGLAPLVKEHDAMVDAACAALESGEMARVAAQRGGDGYDPAMLPASCIALKAAIRVNVRIVADLGNNAIASALAGLAEDTRKEVEARLKADAAALETEGQAGIVGFVLDEIGDFLKDAAKRTSREAVKGTKWATLMGKVQRIVEKLPSYNVSDDPRIRAAIGRIRSAFADLEPENLKDAAVRKQVNADAKAILADLFGEGAGANAAATVVAAEVAESPASTEGNETPKLSDLF